MATRPQRRMYHLILHSLIKRLIEIYRIIQDCEDALTNWVTQNAQVSSKLSTRARNLSTRRKQRAAEGHDLSGQDSSMKDRDSWVPAEQHGDYAQGEEEEEEEEEEETSAADRGRGEGVAA